MLKFSLKLSAWVFGCIFGLLAAVYLVLWGVNFHDQPASVLVQEFESNYKNRIAIPDDINAFVYVMGFAVAEGEDPMQWGAKRLQLINRLTNGHKGDLENDPLMKDVDSKPARDQVVKTLADKCSHIIDEACLNMLEHGDEAIGLWFKTEPELYQRYSALLGFTRYQENALNDVSMPLPNFAAVLDGQKLFLARAFQLASQGSDLEVLGMLERDAVYWRTALASSDILISKMIALAALRRHFGMGNLILRNLAKTTKTYQVPESWQKSFTKNELSMQSSFRGEWFWFDKTVKNLKQGITYSPSQGYVDSHKELSDVLLVPFLQPQETSNKQAEYLNALAAFFDVPLEQYSEIITKAKFYAEGEVKDKYRVYNFTGNLLGRIALPALTEYVPRVADIEGVRQAALATAELRRQTPAENAIVPYLANTSFKNPYTQESFEWIAEAKAVKFTGLQTGERGTYLFIY